MYLTQKAQKVIKWIAYGIEILMIVLVISFGCALSSKNKALKAERQNVKALTEQVDSLQRYAAALGAENVITVNVSFELNQKNVLSFAQTNAQNVAKEVAYMTRQQLYDSLYVNKPVK